MNESMPRRLNAFAKCLILAAIVSSANVFAEAQATSANELNQGRTSQNGDPARYLAETPVPADTNALPRKAAGPSVDRNRPAKSKRVYLEDYERVHKQVGRKYPTEAHWLGQGRRPN